MSEFAACLLVFFLFALFPLINLLMVAATTATATLFTKNAVAAASSSASFTAAKTAMVNSLNNDLSGGFAKFAKITASGGYTGCGGDLYIVYSTISGSSGASADTVCTANKALTTAVDTSTYIYEYRVKTSFTIKPFVDMSSVPLISAVPLVGAATPFTATAERSVEEPTGLTIGP